MGDFPRDVAWTIAREGGDRFTDFPWDPGGPTKYGISSRSHPGLDIRALTLAQAEAIYERDYWAPAGCAQLPEPLALNLFDAAVNAGPGRAKGLLAVPRIAVEPAADAYLWARITFYTDLVIRHPEKRVSLAGWLKRCLLARAESAARAV